LADILNIQQQTTLSVIFLVFLHARQIY